VVTSELLLIRDPSSVSVVACVTLARAVPLGEVMLRAGTNRAVGEDTSTAGNGIHGSANHAPIGDG
jgi:hypothetical protein